MRPKLVQPDGNTAVRIASSSKPSMIDKTLERSASRKCSNAASSGPFASTGGQRRCVACGWLSVSPAFVMRMNCAFAWSSAIEPASR